MTSGTLATTGRGRGMIHHRISPFFLLAVLFLFNMDDYAVNAQSSVNVRLTVPDTVDACGTLDFSWVYVLPDTVSVAQVSATNVTVWATDLGVDQSSTASSSAVAATPSSVSSLTTSASSAIASITSATSTSITTSINTTPITETFSFPPFRRSVHYPRQTNVNMTIMGPLALSTTSTVVWSPVKLTPNVYYVLSLASTSDSPIIVTTQTTRFFVAAGSNTACLEQAPTTTSGTIKPTVIAATTKHNGISSGGIAGAVVGGLGLLALFVFLGVLCFKRRRKVKRREGRFRVKGAQSFLPSANPTPGMEKDQSQTTLAGSQNSRGVNHGDGTNTSKYGGLLAAIGRRHDDSKRVNGQSDIEGGQGSLRYSQASRNRSDSFLQNIADHSAPQTTVEGTAETHRKGSAGSSQELGAAVGNAMMDDPSPPLVTTTLTNRSRSGSMGKQSVHTRKSSSVTSFAQSANLPSWEASSSPPQTMNKRRSSSRSLATNFLPQLNMNSSGNRRSAGGDSGEDFIQMTPVTPAHEGGVHTWTGAGGGPPPRAFHAHPPSRAGSMRRSNSLPPGAAVPALIGSGRSDPSEKEQTPSSSRFATATVATTTSNVASPVPNIPPSPTRRRSGSGLPRTIARKRAPQLPTGMEALMINQHGDISAPFLDHNSGPTSPVTNLDASPTSEISPQPYLQPQHPHLSPPQQPYSFLPHSASASSLGTTATRLYPAGSNSAGKRTSMDAMKRMSGLGVPIPAQAGQSAFDGFAGAKTDGAVLLMPDMPMEQRQ